MERLDHIRPIIGVFMICMEMLANGAWIGMGAFLVVQILLVPLADKSECYAAAVGMMERLRVRLHIGVRHPHPQLTTITIMVSAFV